jgi:predicted nucleotidyltransferase
VEQNIQEYINQTTLNPILFDGLKIKPKVKEILLKIANYFWNSMELDINYQDVLLLGSSANYNWTENSDIDLHIIVDFSQFDDPELTKKYFNSAKSKFNESHDLKIGDNEIELYIQDSNESNSSIGIFSIPNNKWIQDPIYEKVEIPDSDIAQEADNFKQQIDQLIQLSPSKDTIDQISKFIDGLKQYRQSGLDKDGEYSIKNLAFKELRNSGYIEKIINYKNEVIDKTLVSKLPLDETTLLNLFENDFIPIDFLSKIQEKKDPFGLNAYALELAKNLKEVDPKTGTGKKPKKSGRRLYTDENPKDTVSIKFKTKEDIVTTLNKTSFKSKSHARQSQIINLIHQRVRAAYQNSKDPEVKSRLKRALDYITKRKETSKKKTERLNKLKETPDPQSGKAAPYGSGYAPIEEIQTPEQVKDFKTLLLSLTEYLKNNLNVSPLPKLKFIDDDKANANDILGTTAYYDPNNKFITLFTFGRHPKDVLRSYAHEMIHHMQNLENRLTNISTTNINEDDYLKELEREAYEKGNILFREWENSLENN